MSHSIHTLTVKQIISRVRQVFPDAPEAYIMSLINDAINELKDEYSPSDFKEIVEHGCVSGAARSHIYYTETEKFYDKYEEDIVEYLEDTYGVDYLGNVLLQEADNLLRHYKNSVVWIFIELIALDELQEVEEYLEVAK